MRGTIIEENKRVKCTGKIQKENTRRNKFRKTREYKKRTKNKGNQGNITREQNEGVRLGYINENQDGKEGLIIPGYNKIQKGRQTNKPKGGGIAIWVRDSLAVQEIEKITDSINSERIWIKIIKTGRPIIALGVIYMRPDSLISRQSNECLTNLLAYELRQFQEEGCNILMMGDFNGHTLIGKGEKRTAVDNNGKNLLKIVKLIIANDSEKCTGRWTWMRKANKSVIDYVLMDDYLHGLLQEMVIDDEGARWEAGSDHNLIELRFDIQNARATKQEGGDNGK